MKKCDLHIHTISTVSDSAFTFSLDVLEDYVQTLGIDVIAITNHNIFNKADYISIKNRLSSIVVLPGIEVDLEGGHILVISSDTESELFEFDSKCTSVASINSTSTSSMSLVEFTSIFTDLNKYLLIPHYDKSPSLPKNIIDSLSDNIFAGEVCSIKKFIYMQKQEDERLTPVLFSDCRLYEGMTPEQYPIRQTFLDINGVNINALRICLRDKSNATLTRQDGNSLFPIFSNGQCLSTGLNIMYGKRSTGKTWTLSKIAEVFGDRAKYIKQFELQNFGRNYSSEQFESEQKVRLEESVASFFKPFKEVVDDIILLSNSSVDNADIDIYLSTLLKRAEQENVNDVYSSSVLYDEISYRIENTQQLTQLIDATILLIENTKYKEVINKYLNQESLCSLLKELIQILRNVEYDNRCKTIANNILSSVKTGLEINAALPVIPEIDFYSIAIKNLKRKKFVKIVEGLKEEKVIHKEQVLQFKIAVSTKLFANATESKEGLSIGASLVHAFRNYEDPLKYLFNLIDAGIESSKLHRLFVGVKYSIHNAVGHEVSGGERSEFTFLQKIKDARTKDILIIDEPESSFDNIFLKRDINKFIKDMSKEMPVVVSTHNNTIGGSIKPDFILYSDKEIAADGSATFLLYSGYPTDRTLRTIDGRETNNYRITIDSLEAGEEAYNERNDIYEALKD